MGRQQGVYGRNRFTRLTVAAIATAFALLASGFSGVAAAQDEEQDLAEELGLFGDGPDGHQTEPIFSVANAIQQNVWVEGNIDSDGDGNLDRIGVRIRRPDATAEGLKVPAIIAASPYNGGTRSTAFANAYLTELGINVFGEEIDPPALPYSPNFFLARGYAVIDADMAGTNTSTGCPSTGGPADIEGIKAVVEWINGEGTAYTTKFGNSAVVADWSTGDSALIGVSYVGTLPTGVAATGVEGLKTIVPIAAISSWYNYFRANGTVKTGYFDPLAVGVLTREDYRQCDDEIIDVVTRAERRTGNFNEYWDERNYNPDVGNIGASVFLVHGLTDWNVMTQHAGQLWDELTAHDIPRKLWWHRGAHTSPANVDNARWTPVLHRWFDHWLYGLDSGIMDEPMVDVQNVQSGSWSTYPDWPVPGSDVVDVYLAETTPTAAGKLALGPAGADVSQTFTETYTVNQNTIIGNGLTVQPYRRVFLSPVLGNAVRLSGTPWLDLHARISGDAHVSAILMDYSATGVGGANQVVSRGWLDAKSARTMWEEDPINPDRRYSLRFEQMPKDYVFQAGRRIGVVVTGGDRGIFSPTGATPATFDLSVSLSKIKLPLVGGWSALGIAAECAGLEPTIMATSGGGVINGTDGDDVIWADNGSYVINAGGGDDVICAGGGNNTINGGAGDDVIFAGDGNNTIDGGAGDDTITTGSGGNTIYGGADNDTINGGAGDDFIDGGNGDDTIHAGDGDNTVHGSNGNDTITAGFGNDLIFGGTGRDLVRAGPGNDVIHGDAGDDELYGDEGDDTIYGGTGNDLLDGGPGVNHLDGGLGSDVCTLGATTNSCEVT